MGLFLIFHFFSTTAKIMTDCGSKLAVSHRNANVKQSVSVKWIAPNKDINVAFKFTVVQDYSTFWIQQPATNTLVVSLNEQGASSESSAEAEGEGEAEGEAEPEDPSTFHADYQGCQDSKGCFGTKFPTDPDKNCVKYGNCEVMVSYEQVSNGFQFMLHGKLTTSNNYFAVGVSTDDKMGGDLVFTCIDGSSNPVKATWNDGKSNDGAEVSAVTISNAQTTSADSVSKTITR